MKKLVVLFACMRLMSLLLGQDETPMLKIIPTFGSEPLRLDQAYAFEGDSVRITKLRFYISAVSLWQAGKKVWTEPQSYHLLDLAEPEGMDLALKKGIVFDEVRFQLGIDSATNVSGAMGGDLDPTKGMYWSWNTGYINFKLEGKSALTGSRNQGFIYHLGGYLPPFPTVQQVQLKCEAGQAIEMDVYRFLQAVDLSAKPNLMSPSDLATQLSAVAASAFKIADDE